MSKPHENLGSAHEILVKPHKNLISITQGLATLDVSPWVLWKYGIAQ